VHFALSNLLRWNGPMLWRDIVATIGRSADDPDGHSEISLRRARRRVGLRKHWVAAGWCEWWLPDARPNPDRF
jgi:hypothetical protein